MTKMVRFDAVPVGATFRYTGDGLTNDFVKTSARIARFALPFIGGDAADTVPFKPSAHVTIEIPDPPPPTPEELAADRAAHLTRMLDAFVQDGERAVAKFKSELDKNPLYAFEWAGRTIDAVARQDVGLRLKQIVDHTNGGVDVAIKEATLRALHGARSPEHSTSPISNFTKEAVTAAYAEVADRFFGFGGGYV